MAALHLGIEAANNQFMSAVETSDEEKFVRLYTDDAILLFPGLEPLHGQSGVRKFFASFATRGIRRIKVTTLEVEAFDHTAWERGTFEQSGADGAVIGKGKYIVIWKRIADGWKLHRDIVNASP